MGEDRRGGVSANGNFGWKADACRHVDAEYGCCKDVGEARGQAGKPLPAEQDEDGGAVDAEQAERSDDGRNAAQHDDGCRNAP